MNLPKKIDIVEVGPRDGLQNLADFIPTEHKIRLIELLVAAGVKYLELTSFVHPKAIPQLADAMEVTAAAMEKYGGDDSLYFNALVPNERGAENAVKCGLDTVSVVISASEAHNRANVNRTVDESLEGLADIAAAFPELNIRFDMATAFGCPFEGPVPEGKVLSLIGRAADIGIAEVVLCDTIGIADPAHTESLISAVKKAFPKLPLAMHMHDTRGLGLANILTGMQCGVTAFETSVGGLGGCPFAPGAAGNTTTEDLLNMADRMGVETGVSLSRFYDAIYFVKGNIKEGLTSRMAGVPRSEGSIDQRFPRKAIALPY
ncbi:MAG: hydroxymethylglutaryl-CoA lyase [Clostridiales Family XIII bacterium]|nr:hydroxymethylglutaryl-CoA lyase [Clostridiales Family XIII bacterium]